MISRPLARGIDLLASGPHGKQYQAVWQDDATKEKEAEGLPLRPGCELAALLGPFMLMDNEGKASELPIGPYSISAAWKQQEGQAAEPPQIARKQEVDVVEFPFHVRLSAGRHPHTLEEPLIVRISLENHGSVPVCFLNRFYPFKHHFRIVLKREMDERGGQAAHGPDLVPLSVLPKISPDAGTGWITLQPGESLHVSFDAMGYLKDEGVYALQVAYQRRILIRDPKTGPRSTEQYRWESDTIRLNVAAKK
ncbi:MAG: hypothetical protein HQ592_03590 [Planctomycetes bacterium]|nr:hypothetical protein [Planctomycetota bacterium]